MLFRPQNFAWEWKPNDILQQCASDEQWYPYSSIDNEIIEDAYQEKRTHVEIDDDVVLNFTLQCQYQKGNEKNQCIIRRTQLATNNDRIHFREERFSTPIAMNSSKRENGNMLDNDEPEFIRSNSLSYTYFYNEVMDRGKTLADVIEEGANGILKEGEVVGKPHQARWLAQKLMAVKPLGEGFPAALRYQGFPYGISQTCIYLYSTASFWYKRFNSILREWTTTTHERIKTCGPFCLLLINSVIDSGTGEHVIVYRGVDLTDEQRHEFIANPIRFEAFTSTSRNRNLSQCYGNTLLILNLSFHRSFSQMCLGTDISYYNFPDEEEYLLLPGIDFFCDEYEYDTEKNQHILYLYNR